MVAADVRELPDGDSGTKNLASGVDREIYAGNQRIFDGRGHYVVRCPVHRLHDLSYRCDESLSAGDLGLPAGARDGRSRTRLHLVLRARFSSIRRGVRIRARSSNSPCSASRRLLILTALGQIALAVATGDLIATGAPPDKMVTTFGLPIIAGTGLAILATWLFPPGDRGQARAWRSAPRPRRDCGGRLYHCPCAFPAHPRPGLPASQ